jgi:hypothetical protein
LALRRRGGSENTPADLGVGAGAVEGRLASTPRLLVSETGYPFRELMAAGQEQPALLYSEVVLN